MSHQEYLRLILKFSFSSILTLTVKCELEEVEEEKKSWKKIVRNCGVGNFKKEKEKNNRVSQEMIEKIREKKKTLVLRGRNCKGYMF